MTGPDYKLIAATQCIRYRKAIAERTRVLGNELSSRQTKLKYAYAKVRLNDLRLLQGAARDASVRMSLRFNSSWQKLHDCWRTYFTEKQTSIGESGFRTVRYDSVNRSMKVKHTRGSRPNDCSISSLAGVRKQPA